MNPIVQTTFVPSQTFFLNGLACYQNPLCHREEALGRRGDPVYALVRHPSLDCHPREGGDPVNYTGLLRFTRNDRLIPSLFAAGKGQSGEAAGNPPPSDSGAAGSGGGGRRAKRVSLWELEGPLEDLGKGVKSVDDYLGRVNVDLSKLADRNDKLDHIRLALDILMKISAFGPQEKLRVIHGLIQVSDSLTGRLTPARIALREKAVYNNHIKAFFNLAVEIEKDLLKKKGLTPELSEMIADIYSIQAGKGDYGYTSSNYKKSVDNYIAQGILRSIDAIKRYQILGLDQKAGKLLTFLEDVKKIHNLPADVRSWTFEKQRENITRTFSGIFNEDTDRQPIFEQGYTVSLDGITSGLYLFSPFFFQAVADVYRQNGREEAAKKYELRAEEERKISLSLGLIE